MLKSFKLKIAIFSFATSGVILLSFALLFLTGIRRSGLERIDRQLLALADGQMRRQMATGNWERFGDSLSNVFGASDRQRFLLRVIDADGAVLYTSAGWPSDLVVDPADMCPPAGRPFARFGRSAEAPFGPLPPPRRLLLPSAGEGDGRRFQPLARMPPARFQSCYADGRNWRFVMLRNPHTTMLVGTDLTEHQAELKRLRTVFAVAGSFALLLLAAGAWLLAGQALRPIRHLARVTGAMTAKDLNRRVESPGADREFRELIEVSNGMLDRLEKSFNQAARFSADAAHELKTPLAILQGQINQLLQRLPTGSEEQRACAGLLEEVVRLKSITRKLLLLAQSDAGRLRLTRERVCVAEELQHLCADVELLAPDIVLRCDIQPGVELEADPVLLRQLLQNLLTNAVKHNRPEGEIECGLRLEGGNAVIRFANTVAPGAMPERGRLFDRFYRGDTAHNRREDGSGLGLSLAREISRAHGGQLLMADDEQRPGWIAFCLTLPLEPA